MGKQSGDLCSALMRDLDLCFVPGVTPAAVGKRVTQAVGWAELTTDERASLFQHAERRMSEHDFDEYAVSEAWETVALSSVLHEDAARWLVNYAFANLDRYPRDSQYRDALMSFQILRLLMLSRSDIPVDVVDRVARFAVLGSHVTVERVTSRLAAMQRVATAAVQRPTCPVDVLEAACWHPFSQIRKTAARNPNTPTESAVAAVLAG